MSVSAPHPADSQPDSPAPLPPLRPIVLVGLMGVGKTTIGKRLSTALALPFVDADTEIEKAAGRTIAEIFKDFGEEEFRDGEERVISRLMTEPPAVIATGGGAFIRKTTRELILKHGHTIWLRAELATLVERTARRNTRPLLNNGNPAEILAKLAEQRDPLYALAPHHIWSDKLGLDGSTKAIIKTLHLNQEK